MMDCLGIGENRKLNSPEQLSIESQGAAVAQMVNYLKVQKLVLYGYSFGTTVATVAASKLTATKFPDEASFKGVFLEGVVGKGDYKNYEKSFARAAVSKILFNGDGLNQIRASACQIMSSSQDEYRQKIFGGLVTVSTPVPKGTCNCKTLSKVWDPDEYPIKGVPVLYVNGQQDPNTAVIWRPIQVP
jgi:pimeloyl-ACP methyl ester carboxylesterase